MADTATSGTIKSTFKVAAIGLGLVTTGLAIAAPAAATAFVSTAAASIGSGGVPALATPGVAF